MSKNWDKPSFGPFLAPFVQTWSNENFPKNLTLSLFENYWFCSITKKSEKHNEQFLRKLGTDSKNEDSKNNLVSTCIQIFFQTCHEYKEFLKSRALVLKKVIPSTIYLLNIRCLQWYIIPIKKSVLIFEN